MVFSAHYSVDSIFEIGHVFLLGAEQRKEAFPQGCSCEKEFR